MGAVLRRQVWRKDRRAMLVAEFLASDVAEDLSDLEAASRCADHIVEYGCERDFGRPLRMSPAKVEAFLLDWLPRKVMLSRSEQDAMPHVLLAWVRWATAREGLSDDGIAATLDAVFDAMRAFPNVYRDPASFGLEPALVARLLPDGDLEALARRAFAFPLLRGTYHGVDLATLDPAQPGRPALAAGRRPRGPVRAAGQRPAPGAARGAGRPAVARRSPRAVGRRAAAARPGRGPALGAARADERDPAGRRRRERHRGRAGGPDTGGAPV